MLPPRGDYRTLLSFQKAEVVYDITFRFAHKFLAKGDRTIDQMIQSARSGKKNILEGSKAGFTSKETEIKLTNVARASLEELVDDYRDFLRARDLPLWSKESREARFVRRLGCRTPQSFEIYRDFVETRPAAVVANLCICLLHQTNYLLDQQMRRLAADFVDHGGLKERMTARAPLAARRCFHLKMKREEKLNSPPACCGPRSRRAGARLLFLSSRFLGGRGSSLLRRRSGLGGRSLLRSKFLGSGFLRGRGCVSLRRGFFAVAIKNTPFPSAVADHGKY